MNTAVRVALAIGIGLSAGAQHALADEPVRAHEQMVVAANPHASEAGIRILREGGSAVDAAIAVQLVLSMVEPQSSGIGGGAFLLHYDASAEIEPTDRVTVYAGRETAPAGAGAEMFLDEAGQPGSFFEVGFGGLPVGVPGVMRMLELAHRDHGRLEWENLFEPAIELAERGFEISPRLFFLLNRFERTASAPEFKARYYDADGKAYSVGHLLVNMEYADTLRVLAAEGADAMYIGQLARAIVARVGDNPISAGSMTLADLAAYEPRKASALCTPYRVYRVCGPRLPSSGGIAVQQILAMVERFDLAANRDDRMRFVHIVSEASRLAFADRNFYLADPDFIDVPAAALMSGAYLRSRSQLIDATRAMSTVVPGTPSSEQAFDLSSSRHSDLSSTSHFSIIDRYGSAIAMTSSVQGAFGSQLMVGGFILNNQLTDFSTEPVIDGLPVANRADAGKRPLSSMTPTIVLDESGRIKMLIGSPGGRRIINYVSQAILNVLDLGMNIQDAVAAPHFVAQGARVEIEADTDLASEADGLRELGHAVVLRGQNSGLHGIVVEYGSNEQTLYGGVDPRREGTALGD
jgi:gamma-glutamyltranspeptidase/glutathione hydrolase